MKNKFLLIISTILLLASFGCKEYQITSTQTSNTKIDSTFVGDDHYEVILSVTLGAEIGEKTAFLAEVQQAGLFLIKDFSDQQTHQLLGAAAPESLYPYVREAISGLISKTGFPTIQLTPVNFMGLYMENMQRAQAEAQTAGEETAGSETVQ